MKRWQGLFALFIWGGGLAPASAASLHQIMRQALENDARVPASLAISRADDARAGFDRSSLLPQISASAALGQNNQTITSEFFGSSDETYRDTSLALTLRQPVFRYDMRKRWQRSELREQMARAQETLRRQDFLLRVVDRYSAVLEAEAELAFARADSAALELEQSTIEDRERVGLTTVTALRETQARAAVAAANLLLAEDGLRQAEDALSELIGGPVPTLRPLPQTLPRFATTDEQVEDFVQRAAEQGPEVQVERIALAIARTEVTSAIAEAAPKLDLVGRLSEDDSSRSRIGQEREASRIALELSIPIYAGGLAWKGLAAARADVDQFEARLDLRVRMAEQEARNAWRAVDTQYRRLSALQAAAAAADIALAATQDGLEIGSRTQLDLLEARSAALRSARDQTLARYALLRALARREAAVADLHFDDFPRFDALLSADTAPTR